jgi:hypothetical protein
MEAEAADRLRELAAVDGSLERQDKALRVAGANTGRRLISIYTHIAYRPGCTIQRIPIHTGD